MASPRAGEWSHIAVARGRPGRPRIDSTCRDLIRRFAAENRVWGDPRIRGELLKLRVAVSERTVSRYLRGCPTPRSQTWRTFFANHLGALAFMSPVMSSSAPGSDDLNASSLSFRRVPSSLDGLCAANYWVVDWREASTHVPWPASDRRSCSRPCRRAKTHRPGPAAASPVATGFTAYWRRLFVHAYIGPLRPTAV
jgi:hypothetical protein